MDYLLTLLNLGTIGNNLGLSTYIVTSSPSPGYPDLMGTSDWMREGSQGPRSKVKSGRADN